MSAVAICGLTELWLILGAGGVSSDGFDFGHDLDSVVEFGIVNNFRQLILTGAVALISLRRSLSLHRHNIKRRAEELVYKTHFSRQELGSGPFRPAEGSRITALAEPLRISMMSPV